MSTGEGLAARLEALRQALGLDAAAWAAAAAEAARAVAAGGAAAQRLAARVGGAEAAALLAAYKAGLAAVDDGGYLAARETLARRLLALGLDDAAVLLPAAASPEAAQAVLLADLLLLHEACTECARREHSGMLEAVPALHPGGWLDRLLGERIARARESGAACGLALVEVRNLTEVAVALGEAAAAELVRGVAARLREAVREGDVVFHTEGRRLGVFLDRVAAEALLELAAGKMLRALEEPLEVAGRRMRARVALGLSRLPGDAAALAEAQRHAGLALAAAVTSGREVVFFDPALAEANRRRLELAERLREARERDELQLHYQPKVRLADGAVVGVEALLRWHPQGRDPVPPDVFVPLAEEMGMVHELTRWVLMRGVREAAAWHRDGLALDLAVNLSVQDLARPDLVDEVVGALTAWDCDPARLTVEVTETAMMHERERAEDALGRLRALGVKVAVDDFGTGYSSLQYLRRLPVTELKIDRSFVAAMAADAGDRAIVEAVLGLAHGLGLGVVAEGVEDEATREALHRLGCDTAQGWLFSRPLPEAALRRFVAGAA
ncbi:putative bifunctional diguanylate cyclase/phosphodiesterase [Inmirania thermothiophila]|uniref:Diguanylate cyclase (GGDEF)-like protein n=1 Tax=Inmirania thermothiophila TaxID=1750597 RepID=A0A3N1Y869_9GAMM|nr:GGDEF domain-containing phosphodiesterase [Inmirania thermothiophila]ROR35016.1 diguanylate cyclase (GGDEF)-like protein [Inmirania thermothiophila]